MNPVPGGMPRGGRFTGAAQGCGRDADWKVEMAVPRYAAKNAWWNRNTQERWKGVNHV